MKKIKLLMASPLLIAPMVATLPIITSCSKKDVTLSSKFAENVNVQAVSDKLVEGEPYVIKLSIKDDKIGKEYLPNTLASVKTGDTTLSQYTEYEANGNYGYYSYELYNNNTEGYLTIWVAQGSITIEAATAELKEITAVTRDIQSTEEAQFEVGETLSVDTLRVYAYATLTNGQSFILEGGYSIKLDKFNDGYTFTSADVGKTGEGTISYNGETHTFKYKIVNKTVAYLTYSDEMFPSVTKCSTIKEAFDGYNDQGEEGDYYITLTDDNYVLEDSLSVDQVEGKTLTISPLYDFYPVTFTTKTGTALTNYITINGDDTASNTNSEIYISGINFAKPDTSSDTFNDIVIADNVYAPHDITIEECSFSGDSTQTKTINGIELNKPSGSNYSPTNINIYSCDAEYLNNFIDGQIAHDVTSLGVDLTIRGISLENCSKLLNITTDKDARVLIDGIYAEVMYKTNAGTVDKTASAISIIGAGSYWITDCYFKQLSALTAATDDAGFINVSASTPSTDTRQLVLYNIWENRIDDNVHSVINSYITDGADWNISYTDQSGETSSATVVSGTPGTLESNWWDIDEE